MAYLYKKIALGGTFDHLHDGHKELLKKAFSIGEQVIIGVTTDKLTARKKHAQVIEPYEERKKNLDTYLKQQSYAGRATIVELSDSFGPALSDPTVEAVIAGPRVSESVLAQIKKKKDVVRVSEVMARDKGELSSTRIRNGDISREGTVFNFTPRDFSLPKGLRQEFRKPLGSYVSLGEIAFDNSHLLISVGDASFIKLMTEDIHPDIVILDGMIKRKHVLAEQDIRRIAGNEYSVIRTENVSGSLSEPLIHTIREVIARVIADKKKYVLLVRGEDDLAVMPVVSFAPLGTVLLYGQPAFPQRNIKPGLIRVIIDEGHKKYVSHLIAQFKKS